MSNRLPIIVLGGAIVATRAVRARIHSSVLRSLSNGGKPFLGSKVVEIKGKVENLPAVVPSLRAAFTASDLLIRLDPSGKGTGKIPVFELTTGWRRVRWLLAAKTRGPILEVTATPSPAGILNLITVALLVAVIAVGFQPGWTFDVFMAILVGVDAWLRLRIPTKSIKGKLEGMVSARS
jgi:hypothetical protein